jgi:hypothetical protein
MTAVAEQEQPAEPSREQSERIRQLRDERYRWQEALTGWSFPTRWSRKPSSD